MTLSPAVLPPELFAARTRNLELDRSWPDARSEREIISLAYGLADPALFPREDLVAATAEVLADDAAHALNYGPTFAGLIEFVAARMRQKGLQADAQRVLISYGSSQVLALLPQVFIDPGDVVIIEAPTFLGAVRHFREGGARLLSVPVDASGLDVDALAVLLRDLQREGTRPKFIYTIPTFQNPTGATLPYERRLRLLELAHEYGTLIIEDDAYGDLRFEGEPVPALAALDTHDRVLYIGTFSKILAPGVRLGWACGRPEIVERLRMLKLEGSSGPFLTRLVARYCNDGRLDRHIADLNQLYRHKRDIMLAAIAEHFPPEVEVLRPAGGFFVWCRLPAGLSATTLSAQAEAQGVSFLPGSHCFADGRDDDYMRLAFSLQPAEKIHIGIATLGRVLHRL